MVHRCSVAVKPPVALGRADVVCAVQAAREFPEPCAALLGTVGGAVGAEGRQQHLARKCWDWGNEE